MNRTAAIVGTAILIGTMLPACSRDDKHDTAPSSSSSSSAAASSPTSSDAAAASTSPFDISKIDAIKDQFPPGFNVTVKPRTTMTQEMIDQFKGMMGHMTSDPPACMDQLMGALPDAVGSTIEIVVGVQVTPGQPSKNVITASAAETKNPIAQDATNGQCDKFSLNLGQGLGQGTGEKVDAPAIDGVVTHGMSASFTMKIPGADAPINQLSYSAQIDDTHNVSVTGMGDIDQQTLTDLFVKAVNAVKGS